jgi:hypothetical protein
LDRHRARDESDSRLRIPAQFALLGKGSGPNFPPLAPGTQDIFQSLWGLVSPDSTKEIA